MDINDLPAICSDIRCFVLTGQDLNVVMPPLVARYRKDKATA
jgi:hypothetical protein